MTRTLGANSRRAIPKPLRRKVWERAGGCCQFCGRELVDYRPRSLSSEEQGHIDHVVPVSKGGRHTLGNLRLVCATTNMSMGAGDQRAIRHCTNRELW